MKRVLPLILAALVHPANYGHGPNTVKEIRRELQAPRTYLPKVVKDKTTASFNTLSQKGKRRRAKWSNK